MSCRARVAPVSRLCHAPPAWCSPVVMLCRACVAPSCFIPPAWRIVMLCCARVVPSCPIPPTWRPPIVMLCRACVAPSGLIPPAWHLPIVLFKCHARVAPSCLIPLTCDVVSRLCRALLPYSTHMAFARCDVVSRPPAFFHAYGARPL